MTPDEFDARWTELEERRKLAADAAAIKRIDREQCEIILEAIRTNPQDFTLCPDGRYRANVFVTKQ